jgi:hypothetical protein
LNEKSGEQYSPNIEVKNNHNKENDPGINAIVTSCNGGEFGDVLKSDEL